MKVMSRRACFAKFGVTPLNDRWAWSARNEITKTVAAFGWIDDRAIAARGGAGRQACLVDMRCPKDVHHALAFG